jgi:hypothetical protein
MPGRRVERIRTAGLPGPARGGGARAMGRGSGPAGGAARRPGTLAGALGRTADRGLDRPAVPQDQRGQRDAAVS